MLGVTPKNAAQSQLSTDRVRRHPEATSAPSSATQWMAARWRQLGSCFPEILLGGHFRKMSEDRTVNANVKKSRRIRGGYFYAPYRYFFKFFLSFFRLLVNLLGDSLFKEQQKMVRHRRKEAKSQKVFS